MNKTIFAIFGKTCNKICCLFKEEYQHELAQENMAELTEKCNRKSDTETFTFTIFDVKFGINESGRSWNWIA